MVRFSCFSSSPVNRSKKVAQRSMGTLQADYQSATQDQSIKVVKDHVKSNPMPDNYIYSYNSVNRSTSPYSLRDCWRSDGLNVKLPEDNEEIPLIGLIKKSQPLGSIMEGESGRSGDDIMDDDIDREFSFDFLNTWKFKEVLESSDNDYTDSTEIFHHQNDRKIYQNQKKNDLINSIDVPMHHESHFSIEVLKQPDRDWRVDIAEQVVDDAADSRCSPGRIPTLSRSYSVTNLRLNTTERSKNASSHGHIFRRSRSFSDLNNLNILEIELQNDKKYFDLGHAIEKSSSISRSNLPVGHDVNRRVSCYDDTREGGPSLVRRKIVNFRNGDDALRKSEANDAKITRECKQESSCDNWDQLTSQEFSMRRVENWISQIEIHDDLIVQEQGESSTIVPKEETQILAGVDPPKPDARSNLAMEVAHNYIASLTSSSSSAQMANLGLVAIPVLCPFVSLRVLNLSGNALVHITPGCLPKGLHMLNLSKNNISTIEGLGDLSRLRILDLNYNRIARLGHGLASCSSLKELYLAGNKISEVEGLHRLLKLKTLDLRFNKISTSKGLGQLAANYASLQAINLEGNPAQKNVGDEQLKRFLLGLLPNLVYYNKQAIRMGSKDVSDRDSRAVASPQFNRGFRVGHKPSRKGSHGSDLNQLTSNHEQQVSAIAPSRKPSKGKHVRLQLPPASSKLTKLRSDKEKKPLCLNTNNAMKRS